MKITFKRYEPSRKLGPYSAVMNSEPVQADMLRRAERVAVDAARHARARGIDLKGQVLADVQPGQKRAHARASATVERQRSAGSKEFWIERWRNQVAVESLQAAMGSAGGESHVGRL